MDNEIESIIKLVENSFSRLSTSEYYTARQQLPSDQFREQFGTITINLQRGVGHSIAAATLLTKYPNSLIFTNTDLLKTRLLNYVGQNLRVQYQYDTPTIKTIVSDIDSQIVVIPKCNSTSIQHLYGKVKRNDDRDKYDLLIIDDFSHVPYLPYLGIQAVFNDCAHLFVNLH